MLELPVNGDNSMMALRGERQETWDGGGAEEEQINRTGYKGTPRGLLGPLGCPYR